MKISSLLSIIALGFSRLAQGDASKPDIVMPTQLGPYPVTFYQHEIKTQRKDILAPIPQLRRLMITVYRPITDNFTCPIEHQSLVPYAPPVVLDALFKILPTNLPPSENASTLLGPIKLLNCTKPISASQPRSPLLLFSHGFGGVHYGYESTIMPAASSGYTVVAIDHTWEAAAVVFPDGEVATYSNVTNNLDATHKGQEVIQSVRIADSMSVLDAIERGEVPGLGRYANSSSSTHKSSRRSNSTATSDPKCPDEPLRAVMYGHSFGGATAANVAYLDKRVTAAANIDGPFYPPVTNATITKPLFMMASSPELMSPDWPAFYAAHVRGWKTYVKVANSVHYGFTDLPQLAALLGAVGKAIPTALTGSINSQRLQEIVWRYTTQFFDFIWDNASPELLDKANKQYPDIQFVGHAEAVKGAANTTASA